MIDSQKETIPELFADYGKEIMRKAKAILGSESDVEDVFQETMLWLFKSPRVLPNIEDFGAWLYTIIKRRCVDLIRKNTVRRNKEFEKSLQVSESVSPAELADEAEVYQAVALAVKELPSELQFVFVENVLNCKTFQEISKQSGVPLGTLLARKQKAVSLIREILEEKEIIL
ncbi:MAG: RNA polymerase sigma factor [Planctomycetota bacterium]